MNAGQISRGVNIRPLRYSLRDTPHATIEINRTCNIRCRTCYNLNRDHVKSLHEVKNEIDLALKKRNLSVITLLGGEPTLHPQLAAIISYIKSKKIFCQLLTNGLVFLQDETDAFLSRIMASGLDKILVHIDTGQRHVYQNIEATRSALFTKLEKKKIPFSLSLTVYNEDRGRIPDLLQRYASYRFFDGILAVLARDPLSPKLHNVEMGEEYESLAGRLRLEPVTYIPSNLDETDVRWLVYFYFLNAKTRRTFSLSPELYRSLKWVYRRVKGRQLFTLTARPVLASWLCLAAGFGEFLFHPRKIWSFVKFVHDSGGLKFIRLLYLAIQAPPEFHPENNQYQLCYHCPDATIRNDKLTPVCIADQINPLKGDSRRIDPIKYRAVYVHLQEIR
jgi:hypothetical protein